jgi:NitT/TauT family transport system substrate-binding protein
VQRFLWAVSLVFFLIYPVPSESQTIRISHSGLSGYDVPIWVAHDAGLFKKHGLATELILIGGGSTNVQALLSNEIRFSLLSGSAPILAILQGAPVVIIATPYTYIPYSLVVGKDIRSPEDLKGKRIAISRLGGITEVAANLAFEKLGLGAKDMTFVQAGPDPQRIAAVRSGAAAATVVAPPGLFAATSLGLRVFADLSDLGIKYPTEVIVTTRSFLSQHRGTVKQFLMGFVEALQVYTQRKEYVIGVMQKYTKLTDREILSKSHDYFAKNTALLPLTDPIAVRNGLPSDKADVKVQLFYDNSLLEELAKENRVDR